MSTSRQLWANAAVRAIVVAGSVILVGYALYPHSVFTLTMRAFQFVISGVTAGLTYAATKSPNVRNGLAGLVVWFVGLTWLIEEFNTWLIWLNSVYIVVIAATIVVHGSIGQRPFFRLAISRILLAGILFALANGLIILILFSISGNIESGHVATILGEVLHNLEIGALIGLAAGCGIQIAELLTARMAGLHAVFDEPPAGQ